METKQSKVYIVNKSAHDFSCADKYGKVIYLSEGPINRYACNNMFRMFSEAMKESNSSDHIVPCSLNVMNSICCAIFAHKHGRLNLLLFKEGEYVERNLIFDGEINKMMSTVSHTLDEICGNCGKSCGEHLAGIVFNEDSSVRFPKDYCPDPCCRMDWKRGPGTIFKPTGQYKE